MNMANKLKINEEKYVTLVEPSLKEARMRKRNNIEINQFLLNSKYLNLGSRSEERRVGKECMAN